MKKLVLAYELTWRTKDDERFRKSKEWEKIIRPRILKRDNYTCAYCGYQSETGMQVSHIDGNPKNNTDENLEVICRMCHMILHSGLWCEIFKTIEVYRTSKYNQNEIIRITRKQRSEGKSDQEIRDYLGLKDQVPWKMDLEYLSVLYGFISSRKGIRVNPKPILSEQEQKSALTNRDKW